MVVTHANIKMLGRIIFVLSRSIEMAHGSKVIRFSVSLPPTLVQKFDSAWRSMHYDNRSKAIHDAIRSFINEYEVTKKTGGKVAGVVLLLYYLDKPGLLEEIVRTQHMFTRVVSSTLHFHLEEHKCLEMIAVEGDTQEIRKLAETLAAKKGVQQVKVASVAP
jgi:CopG family nickel-responsive transcriptional regulator